MYCNGKLVFIKKLSRIVDKSSNKMCKDDCLDGNRTRRLPVLVFHNSMFRGCVKNHMKHKCCKGYYLCFGVYVFAVSCDCFTNYTHESTANILKSMPNQSCHFFHGDLSLDCQFSLAGLKPRKYNAL